MELNPKTLSKSENYQLLIGSVLPRPIAFVTSENKDGILNGAPFSFYNVVCADPPLISISIGRKRDGSLKDTSRNIQEHGEFVVHLVDEDNVTEVNGAAASLPPDVSEITQVRMTPVKSHVVHVRGVKEAKIRLECKLHQVIPLGGTTEQPQTDLIIGEVVHYVIDDQYIENNRLNTDNLNPVSRLGKTEYAELGTRFSLDRPK